MCGAGTGDSGVSPRARSAAAGGGGRGAFYFLKITLLHIRQGSTNILIGYISWCCKHRDKLRSQGPTPRSPETKEVPRGARASARDAEAKGAGTADHVVVPPIRLGLHLLPVQVLQQRVGAYVRILIRDVGLPPQCMVSCAAPGASTYPLPIPAPFRSTPCTS